MAGRAQSVLKVVSISALRPSSQFDLIVALLRHTAPADRTRVLRFLQFKAAESSNKDVRLLGLVDHRFWDVRRLPPIQIE